MKQTKNYLFGIIAVTAIMLFSSCEENNVIPQGDSFGILPERFKVDIPNSLSNSTINTSLKSSSEYSDTLNGDEIYENLTYFIAIGEASADVVEAIIYSIKRYKIENVIDLTYTSDEDFRVKHLSVIADSEFEGENWEYQLTITDVESEGNADKGIGMQFYWNNDPIEGVALLKPYNLNRIKDADAGDAMFSIEYSEAGMNDYEAYMIIEIADFPTPDISVEPFAVDNIKMFVGKKGDIIDVYGNSNHPNATFYTENTGYNWAFVASGNEEEDIAVAEIGLPSNTLNTTSRDVILKENSIKNVLTTEINQWFLDTFGIRPHEEDLSNYLRNADAPGYFNDKEFIQGGTAPNDSYGELEQRINNLTPYTPKTVNDLEISFK